MSALTENQKILVHHHKQWLESPMTKQLLSILGKHEISVADALATSAMDKDKTDDHVRRLATQLATVKQIKKLMYESESFVVKSSSN